MKPLLCDTSLDNNSKDLYTLDMRQPLLSIIIPVWNASDNIRHIVNSVLSQSLDNFELILIDDGSSDDTLSVLHAIEKTDKRVKVYTKPNGGPSSARNLGLEKAQGKYIQFYDSDDDIPSGALHATTSILDESKSDIIVSGWQIDLQTSRGIIRNYKQIIPQEEVVSSNVALYVLRSLGNNGLLYNLWNKLFRADIIHKYQLRFREDIRFGEDVLFSLEYFKHVQKLYIIPDVTYHYQANSKTSVFSSSSLVPEYRLANDEAIIAFAKTKPNREERDLLNWLRWRWLISYWSCVVGSQKRLNEKLYLIKQFNPKSLQVSRVSVIGVKKSLIQCIALLARTTTYSSLLLGWSINILKKTVVSIKRVKNRQ